MSSSGIKFGENEIFLTSNITNLFYNNFYFFIFQGQCIMWKWTESHNIVHVNYSNDTVRIFSYTQYFSFIAFALERKSSLVVKIPIFKD